MSTFPTYLPNLYKKSYNFMVPGEQLSFMINSILPAPTTGYTAKIIDASYTPVSSDLGVLYYTYSSGRIYYCTFVAPLLAPGEYKIALFDGNDPFIKYCTNSYFIPKSDYANYSVYLKYRNDRNIFGYTYEQVPTFYNMCRISLVEILRQPEYNIDVYISSTTKKRRVYNDNTQMSVQMDTLLLDDDALEALSVIFDHSDVSINGEQITFKSGLKSPPSGSNSKGVIEFYLDNFVIDKNISYV